MSCEDIRLNKKKLFEWFKHLFLSHQTSADSKAYVEKVLNDLETFCADGSAILFGAYKDEFLCGIIWAYKQRVLDEKRIHITRLYVDSKFRGQGIATMLMNELEKNAINDGIYTIDLNVNENNEGAKNMYLKNNFSVDSVHMIKRIKMSTQNNKE